jgi:ribonucleoside-diphosphate reductase alpha chain
LDIHTISGSGYEDGQKTTVGASRKGRIWGKRNQPMRNAAVTTIAPTGSISLIAACSSGIEPIFSLACKRRALDGQEFVEIHPPLEKLGHRQGWLTADVREALMEGTPPAEIPGIPKDLAEALVTAHEVPAEWHVKMQAAFQANVDNAVSKTVNLPATATLDDVDGVFRLAFESGCKGITVYRDGSRSGQTLSSSVAAGEQTDGAQPSSSPRPRGRVTTGYTSKFRMGCGTLFVTVNRDRNGLCEVFANLGKAGGCPSQSEATCRAVSAALRSGVDPKELVEQLRGIRCLSTARAKGNGSGITVQSCPDAIARAIEEAIGEDLPSEDSPSPGLLCPECQQPLNREAGCFVCQACGYSKCG